MIEETIQEESDEDQTQVNDGYDLEKACGQYDTEQLFPRQTCLGDNLLDTPLEFIKQKSDFGLEHQSDISSQASTSISSESNSKTTGGKLRKTLTRSQSTKFDAEPLVKRKQSNNEFLKLQRNSQIFHLARGLGISRNKLAAQYRECLERMIDTAELPDPWVLEFSPLSHCVYFNKLTCFSTTKHPLLGQLRLLFPLMLGQKQFSRDDYHLHYNKQKSVKSHATIHSKGVNRSQVYSSKISTGTANIDERQASKDKESTESIININSIRGQTESTDTVASSEVGQHRQASKDVDPEKKSKKSKKLLNGWMKVGQLGIQSIADLMPTDDSVGRYSSLRKALAKQTDKAEENSLNEGQNVFFSKGRVIDIERFNRITNTYRLIYLDEYSGDPSTVMRKISVSDSYLRAKPQAILDYAIYLDIRPSEYHLFWIARMIGSLPAPSLWREIDLGEGKIFVNVMTFEEMKIHPAIEFAREILSRARTESLSLTKRYTSTLSLIDAIGRSYNFNLKEEISERLANHPTRIVHLNDTDELGNGDAVADANEGIKQVEAERRTGQAIHLPHQVRSSLQSENMFQSEKDLFNDSLRSKEIEDDHVLPRLSFLAEDNHANLQNSQVNHLLNEVLVLCSQLKVTLEKDVHVVSVIQHFLTKKQVLTSGGESLNNLIWEFRLTSDREYYWINLALMKCVTLYPFLTELKNVVDIFKRAVRHSAAKRLFKDDLKETLSSVIAPTSCQSDGKMKSSTSQKLQVIRVISKEIVQQFLTSARTDYKSPVKSEEVLQIVRSQDQDDIAENQVSTLTNTISSSSPSLAFFWPYSMISEQPRKELDKGKLKKKDQKKQPGPTPNQVLEQTEKFSVYKINNYFYSSSDYESEGCKSESNCSSDAGDGEENSQQKSERLQDVESREENEQESEEESIVAGDNENFLEVLLETQFNEIKEDYESLEGQETTNRDLLLLQAKRRCSARPLHIKKKDWSKVNSSCTTIERRRSDIGYSTKNGLAASMTKSGIDDSQKDTQGLETIEKYRESSEEKLIINIEDQKGEEEGDQKIQQTTINRVEGEQNQTKQRKSISTLRKKFQIIVRQYLKRSNYQRSLEKEQIFVPEVTTVSSKEFQTLIQTQLVDSQPIALFESQTKEMTSFFDEQIKEKKFKQEENNEPCHAFSLSISKISPSNTIESGNSISFIGDLFQKQKFALNEETLIQVGQEDQLQINAPVSAQVNQQYLPQHEESTQFNGKIKSKIENDNYILPEQNEIQSSPQTQKLLSQFSQFIKDREHQTLDEEVNNAQIIMSSNNEVQLMEIICQGQAQIIDSKQENNEKLKSKNMEKDDIQVTMRRPTLIMEEDTGDCVGEENRGNSEISNKADSLSLGSVQRCNISSNESLSRVPSIAGVIEISSQKLNQSEQKGSLSTSNSKTEVTQTNGKTEEVVSLRSKLKESSRQFKEKLVILMNRFKENCTKARKRRRGIELEAEKSIFKQISPDLDESMKKKIQPRKKRSSFKQSQNKNNKQQRKFEAEAGIAESQISNDLFHFKLSKTSEMQNNVNKNNVDKKLIIQEEAYFGEAEDEEENRQIDIDEALRAQRKRMLNLPRKGLFFDQRTSYLRQQSFFELQERKILKEERILWESEKERKRNQMETITQTTLNVQRMSKQSEYDKWKQQNLNAKSTAQLLQIFEEISLEKLKSKNQIKEKLCLSQFQLPHKKITFNEENKYNIQDKLSVQRDIFSYLAAQIEIKAEKLTAKQTPIQQNADTFCKALQVYNSLTDSQIIYSSPVQIMTNSLILPRQLSAVKVLRLPLTLKPDKQLQKSPRKFIFPRSLSPKKDFSSTIFSPKITKINNAMFGNITQLNSLKEENEGNIQLSQKDNQISLPKIVPLNVNLSQCSPINKLELSHLNYPTQQKQEKYSSLSTLLLRCKIVREEMNERIKKELYPLKPRVLLPLQIDCHKQNEVVQLQKDQISQSHTLSNLSKSNIIGSKLESRLAGLSKFEDNFGQFQVSQLLSSLRKAECRFNSFENEKILSDKKLSVDALNKIQLSYLKKKIDLLLFDILICELDADKQTKSAVMNSEKLKSKFFRHFRSTFNALRRLALPLLEQNIQKFIQSTIFEQEIVQSIHQHLTIFHSKVFEEIRMKSTAETIQEIILGKQLGVELQKTKDLEGVSEAPSQQKKIEKTDDTDSGLSDCDDPTDLNPFNNQSCNFLLSSLNFQQILTIDDSPLQKEDDQPSSDYDSNDNLRLKQPPLKQQNLKIVRLDDFSSSYISQLRKLLSSESFVVLLLRQTKNTEKAYQLRRTSQIFKNLEISLIKIENRRKQSLTRYYESYIDCGLLPSHINQMCSRLAVDIQLEPDIVWVAYLYCLFLLKFSQNHSVQILESVIEGRSIEQVKDQIEFDEYFKCLLEQCRIERAAVLLNIDKTTQSMRNYVESQSWIKFFDENSDIVYYLNYANKKRKVSLSRVTINQMTKFETLRECKLQVLVDALALLLKSDQLVEIEDLKCVDNKKLIETAITYSSDERDNKFKINSAKCIKHIPLVLFSKKMKAQGKETQ